MLNLAVLADPSGLFPMTLLHFLSHAHTFSSHLLHDFPSLLIFKLIQLLFGSLSSPLSFLLLSLFLLLHDDLIADHLFQDDVLEDAGQQLVLHGCF